MVSAPIKRSASLLTALTNYAKTSNSIPSTKQRSAESIYKRDNACTDRGAISFTDMQKLREKRGAEIQGCSRLRLSIYLSHYILI